MENAKRPQKDFNFYVFFFNGGLTRVYQRFFTHSNVSAFLNLEQLLIQQKYPLESQILTL